MDKKFHKTKIQKRYDSDFLHDWDLVPSISTLKLFNTNKRLKEAQRDLIIKDIEGGREKMSFLCDWRDIQANKRELRHQLEESDKAIWDNKVSKYRFSTKTQEHLDTQTWVQNVINCTKLEIEKYSGIKENMEKHVSLYSELFESFLKRVALIDQEFNSVQDILIQYEELEHCKNDCAHLLEKEINEALELKRELATLVEEKASRLKVLDNSLMMLDVRQKKATDERKKWNHVVTNIEQEIATKLEESITLKEGSYDLYRFICNKRNEAPIISKEDIKNQIHYINKTILFYKDVIHLATALQQYPTQQSKNEDSVCKSNFVKTFLNDLVKNSIENVKRE